jgi:hypothetical protein
MSVIYRVGPEIIQIHIHGGYKNYRLYTNITDNHPLTYYFKF